MPALMNNGLFHSSEKYFKLPDGYYGFESIVLSIAFGALLRAQTLEQFRYYEPGELGKLIGLDRIPEVKTLRSKIKSISELSDISGWQKALTQHWMEEHQSEIGILYVDGHVRVYHGHQTNLPRRYLSREKLCLRGVTDYWVNDSDGLPFFVVTKEINTGLIDALKKEIVPRLIKDIPNQPTEKDLQENANLFRFVLVFDREGYSFDLFRELWEQYRIAVCTYRKNVQDQWPLEEFVDCHFKIKTGEVITMKIAEKRVFIKSADNLELREIRRLSESGRQISILTKNFVDSAEKTCFYMAARWSQENFFKYMMENYGIDKLFSYKMNTPDELANSPVINPEYRQISSDIRVQTSLLNRKKIKFSNLEMKDQIEEIASESFLKKKAELLDDIVEFEKTISDLKLKRKGMNKNIEYKNLPENEKFKIFKKSDKQFLDTIKMISYRAETSLVNILREFEKNKNEVRSLVKQIFQSSADLEVRSDDKLLVVKLHTLSTPKSNEYFKKLCVVLNATETLFPGTDLKIFYDLGS